MNILQVDHSRNTYQPEVTIGAAIVCLFVVNALEQ